MRHFQIPPLSEFSAKVKDPAFRLDSPTGEEITGTQIEKRERRLGWWLGGDLRCLSGSVKVFVLQIQFKDA